MSTLAVERNVFSEIGLFDTDLDMIEDWDFAIRLARNGLMKSVEAPLAMYRQHAGNRSKDWRRHLQPGFYILKKVFSDESLPTRITRKRARIYSTFYLMICGAAFAASSHFNAVKWGLKAILTHPSAILYILFLPLRRRRVKMDR
jgi:GT2 family glycosyltransferase